MAIAILYVRGYSNSGKTELISRLLKDLSKYYKIGVIKTSKEGFDVEGKDTQKLFSSGSQFVLGVSQQEVLLKFKDVSIDEICKKLTDIFDVDFIIVEGMKHKKGPNIAMNNEFADKDTIAVYNSSNYEEVLKAVKRFAEIAKYYKALPGINCGLCGMNCWDLAQALYENKSVECKLMKELELQISVNNKPIFVNPFVKRLVKNVILSIIKELKGYERGEVVIRLRA